MGILAFSFMIDQNINQVHKLKRSGKNECKKSKKRKLRSKNKRLRRSIYGVQFVIK